jgi:transcriptional regulator with XRE-family HTH domain
VDHDEDELRRQVGKRLRLARYRAELTQDQLAEQAGVSRNFVGLVEHGAHGVDVYRLRRLATAAGTTLGALFNESPTQDGRH